MPVLRRNDQQETADSGVKVLQRLLNNFGFQLTVDGFFGAKTEAAVEQYQDENRLIVDGIVGPKTWNALGACIIITES